MLARPDEGDGTLLVSSGERRGTHDHEVGCRHEHARGAGRVIPRPVLASWRRTTPWREDHHVEQDLLLSILAIAVAQHPVVARHLAWRGGTCLHKLHLDRPRRYSEDLDYVLVGDIAHGAVADALRGRPAKSVVWSTTSGVGS